MAAGQIDMADRFGRFYGEMTDKVLDRVDRYIREGRYIGSPAVDRFESQVADHLGAPFVVGTSSGTAALTLALKAAGVEPGGEVITVANTYYATVRSITNAGATPVFADIEPDGFNMNPSDLETKVTPQTQAILPVHLYGLPADLGGIRKIGAEHGIPVVEDCSHAFGTRNGGALVGSDAQFGCFSLYPTKNLGALGNAGMVTTDTAQRAHEVRRLRYFASDGLREFDPSAEHARLEGIQAVFLSVFLERFPAMRERRQRIARRYHETLPPPSPLEEVDFKAWAPYLYPLYVDAGRDQLVRRLRERGVPALIRYGTMLHRLPEFRTGAQSKLPHTEHHNSRVMTLPVHPALTDGDVDLIIEEVSGLL